VTIEMTRARNISISSGRLTLVLIFLAVTLYNLWKPFHIDDAAYLEIAQWITSNPLRPMSGLLNWDGIDEQIHRVNQPHLYFYLVALWGALFGFSEVGLHLMQAFFCAACFVIFAGIVSNATSTEATSREGLFLVLLLVVSPAFVINQNLMVDIPMLSLWLGFFYVLMPFRGQDTNQHLLASLICSAALLIKYSSLALYPILVFSILMDRKWSRLVYALFPVVTLLAWSAFNYFDYGGFHILQRPTGANGDFLRPVENAVKFVLNLGGLTPIGYIVLFRMFGRYELRLWLAFTALAAAFVSMVHFGYFAQRASDIIVVEVFLVNAAIIVYVLARFTKSVLARIARGGIDADAKIDTYLLLWIFGVLSFYSLFAPFIATRHVLLILPPVILSFWKLFGGSLSRTAKVFALGFTVFPTVALGISDWRFAQFYKSQASEIKQLVPPATRAWTSGHWGWQWYAARAGFKQVDVVASDLKQGDWIIIPREVDHQKLQQNVSLKLLFTVTQDYPGLSMFCTGRPAMFYASPVAWTVSMECLNHIDVFEIGGLEEPSDSR